MSTIARKIAATPKRTSAETWQVICELLYPSEDSDKKTLESISGVAAAIISDQAPEEDPFVVTGNGPRLRIYCLYGEDALSGENSNEEPLVTSPFSENWHLYIPCKSGDISWVNNLLSSVSSNVTVYEVGKDLNLSEENKNSQALSINMEGFVGKL